MLTQLTESIAGCVGVSTNKDGTYTVNFDKSSRLATAAEIEAAIAAAQSEDVRRIESDTARDDAKRALSMLDTIITGIDGATLAQAKTAIKQLAQIQKHIILATVGR